jgi:hypothetical protein
MLGVSGKSAEIGEETLKSDKNNWRYNENLCTFMTVKCKGTPNRPEGPEGGRGIALLFLGLGARRGWVVNTTPRPLYPQERPGTHCTGGWVGPRAGLDVCEITFMIVSG